jgi:hypothetical protein
MNLEDILFPVFFLGTQLGTPSYTLVYGLFTGEKGMVFRFYRLIFIVVRQNV